jgi:hypothetical protein
MVPGLSAVAVHAIGGLRVCFVVVEYLIMVRCFVGSFYLFSIFLGVLMVRTQTSVSTLDASKQPVRNP